MSNSKPKTIKFVYSKIPTYRTYNVDGVYGGITHRNKIFIEFFSEKPPLPESTTHELSDKGELGKETKKSKPTTIIREIEAGIYVDIQTAKVIADWLNARLNDYERLIKKEK